ncbi:chromate transporter [Xaviernesmea oryzae]|uniref:Chromate transporter n=1 Tax=Xaviernesmea oryzae TaxID=464029 RepID=A0A1Q9AZU0_9HYPH|nr:chromate efflux transporter [Xaviernesmea oryzae]OLP61242.1 chromate transporter [Xaviernesmea oryzae]SEL51616.1 chromate transporter [Xaviernesmea oryzae]
MVQTSERLTAGTAVPAHGISFGDALLVWARIAALSFGGPAGQIALMHRVLVEEKRWIGERRFLHALNYCMLLPGPEAQQLATYIGWLMHGVRGGLAAGLLFILPGFLSILGLSFVYVLYGGTALLDGVFLGLKAAVLVIVVQALLRIASRALKGRLQVAVAVAAFLALAVLHLPFPLVIVLAGLFGFLASWLSLPGFDRRATAPIPGAAAPSDEGTALGEAVPAHARPTVGWSLKMAAILGLLWAAPVLASWLVFGPGNVFTAIGLFFSKMAVVTFGGAYAVLAYVAQEAVGHYGWLKPGEMLDGLALAETTPGPLIMVLQFVGFLGAYRQPGAMAPLEAATLGAVLTTWVTFLPCFLFIFLGAPFIERLRGNHSLSAALSAITAAVVGVIANLALWFAVHTLFADVVSWQAGPITLDLPQPASIRPFALMLTAGAAFLVFAMRVSVMPLLGLAALAGILINRLS